MVVLPNKKDGLQNLISNLKKVDLSDLRSKLESRHVQISIPVFEFKSTSYLKEPLRTVGTIRMYVQVCSSYKRGCSKFTSFYCLHRLVSGKYLLKKLISVVLAKTRVYSSTMSSSWLLLKSMPKPERLIF